MEIKTITFNTVKETLPLTQRLLTRLMSLAIWMITIGTLALGFIIAFAMLRFALFPFLEREVMVMLAAGLPALVAGLCLQPLRQAIIGRVENHIRYKPDTITSVPELYDPLIPGIDMAGKKIGSYELQQVIGRGGMAEVYHAVGNDSIVAIKIMHAHYLYDEENLQRFQREGEFGLGMIHDNIVAVYELGEVDNMPYIVMEFVDGEDLRTIIQRTDEYTINDVILWVKDICNALDMAHKQGYVHRDIKPSNIMVRPTGEAVLMDFGIAKFKFATTHLTGASVGTIDYMAPEQIQNSKNIDHRADIYALGIVVFELLTGLLPYEGNIPQIMYAHVHHPPPDPREFNVGVADHVAEAVRKALAKNPDDRYQSAGEFAKALTASANNLAYQVS